MRLNGPRFFLFSTHCSNPNISRDKIARTIVRYFCGLISSITWASIPFYLYALSFSLLFVRVNIKITKFFNTPQSYVFLCTLNIIYSSLQSITRYFFSSFSIIAPIIKPLLCAMRTSLKYGNSYLHTIQYVNMCQFNCTTFLTIIKCRW